MCSRPSRIASLLSVALLLLSGSALQAQQLGLARQERIRQTVLAELESQQAVGVAVGYLEDGRVVYAEGFGDACLEPRREMTDQSVVNWASNSKPVMAVLAMQLVERGLLDLDADIHQYLPDFPPTASRVTARHLLCHQSGIPHYENGRVIGTPQKFREQLPYLDPVNSLHIFNRSPLLFEPGKKYSYSSYAYVLLSAVVQAAGGEPIATQLEERIIRPLGLASLELDLPGSENGHWCQGFARNGDGQVVAQADVAHYWKHGAGGYKSNIRDFARWAQALMNDELISPTTRELMWTVQKPSDESSSSDMALGVFVEGEDAERKVSHNGSQEEAKSRMVIYPATRTGVVILSNSHHAEPARFSTAVYRALRDSP